MTRDLRERIKPSRCYRRFLKSWSTSQNTLVQFFVSVSSSSDRNSKPKKKRKKKSILCSSFLSSLCTMCYGHNQSFSRNTLRSRSHDGENEDSLVVDDLRDRLAETEARLRRARAREAELSRRLEQMKRFVSVMEIMEAFLERRFQEQKDRIDRLFSTK